MDTPTLAQVPVLCLYTYVESGMHARYALRHRGSRMILVERSSDIVSTFYSEMEKDRANWSMWRIGPRPNDIELVSYLPANFQMTF